ncbi:hypothetical protein ACJTM1_14080 [Bacillus sp. GX]|uniref:Uncharacterized protein n=4 Tax=Bacillus cereus group TaxID=86661 RepID=A0A9W5QQM9_BACCE|nr:MULTISPECIES: hypothetical protein [Bacillus]EEM39498.1 hypothetical protein bthur0004_45470 [Bacillus thuringiensis serovar sotto str. T04001]ACK93144.1 conserved hypothetical protein [Bacillus cereus G9842]AFQ18519.1 hypothetical protein BTG_25570 [Bacillus thuringiensis HD-771]EJP94174.1 hypothetical protein IC1_00235 [Bacillus cereus VD022]EOP82985.1 hypothetical protein IGM_05180 [Bacillus cereus HuB4-4]
MAYDLEPEIKEVLEKIDFIQRYKALSKQFPDRENTFENYENEKVIAVFESLGYKARFMKKENFFIVGEVKNKDFYTFRFNISLKYGLVEFIWSARYNGEVRVGNSWDMFVKVLSNGSERLPAVCFHSYDELKEIMKIAFEMYEDFKRELIPIYS